MTRCPFSLPLPYASVAFLVPPQTRAGVDWLAPPPSTLAHF